MCGIFSNDSSDLDHVRFLFVQFLVVLQQMLLSHMSVRTNLQYRGELRLVVPGMDNWQDIKFAILRRQDQRTRVAFK